MNKSVKVCWYCPKHLDIDKFEDSKVLPIISYSGGAWVGFPLLG